MDRKKFNLVDFTFTSLRRGAASIANKTIRDVVALGGSLRLIAVETHHYSQTRTWYEIETTTA